MSGFSENWEENVKYSFFRGRMNKNVFRPRDFKFYEILAKVCFLLTQVYIHIFRYFFKSWNNVHILRTMKNVKIFGRRTSYKKWSMLTFIFQPNFQIAFDVQPKRKLPVKIADNIII